MPARVCAVARTSPSEHSKARPAGEIEPGSTWCTYWVVMLRSNSHSIDATATAQTVSKGINCPVGERKRDGPPASTPRSRVPGEMLRASPNAPTATTTTRLSCRRAPGGRDRCVSTAPTPCTMRRHSNGRAGTTPEHTEASARHRARFPRCSHEAHPRSGAVQLVGFLSEPVAAHHEINERRGSQ